MLVVFALAIALPFPRGHEPAEGRRERRLAAPPPRKRRSWTVAVRGAAVGALAAGEAAARRPADVRRLLDLRVRRADASPR